MVRLSAMLASASCSSLTLFIGVTMDQVLTSVPVSANLTLVQSVLNEFGKQPKIAELNISDLPGASLALSQWLVARSLTPDNVTFFLRGGPVAQLLTLVLMNFDVLTDVTSATSIIHLKTSTASVADSNRIYEHGLYLRMLKEVRWLFGMNTSSYFNFDDNRKVPFVVYTL